MEERQLYLDKLAQKPALKRAPVVNTSVHVADNRVNMNINRKLVMQKTGRYFRNVFDTRILNPRTVGKLEYESPIFNPPRMPELEAEKEEKEEAKDESKEEDPSKEEKEEDPSNEEKEEDPSNEEEEEEFDSEGLWDTDEKSASETKTPDEIASEPKPSASEINWDEIDPSEDSVEIEKEKTPEKPAKIRIPRVKPALVKNAGPAPVSTFMTMEINGRKIEDRLPKPEKFQVKISDFYMNNRKLYTQKLAELFREYNTEILNENDTVSCDNRSAGGGQLFIHQRVVRDYLNLHTPYRGLLLLHGLGSGKTATSIAIAEGMKNEKRVFVLTPASLKINFFSELKKYGDPLYKKNQFWEFVSIDGMPQYLDMLSSVLSLSPEYVKRNGGAWLVDVGKAESNFKTLDSGQQKQLDDQLNQMIRAKYVDINYNGLNKNKMRELVAKYGDNPFHNAVILVDEAHNLVSRISNKLKKSSAPTSGEIDAVVGQLGGGEIALQLYRWIMEANNSRVVFMTGTPMINYPNEIGIMFNMLRGYIKTWTINVTPPTGFTPDQLTQILDGENFRTYDYIDYSDGKITVTRNPFGFFYHKHPGPEAGSHHVDKHVDKHGDKHGDNKGIKTRRMLGGGRGSRRVKESLLDTVQTFFGGRAVAYNKYAGVHLDEQGNITDKAFIDEFVDILKRREFGVDPKITTMYHKCLPDTKDEFNKWFVDIDTVTLKNTNVLKKRILGLTSYFRSAQESLLPSFVKNKEGGIYHIEQCDMSQYQLGEYEKVRKYEADEEKKRAMRASKKRPDEDSEAASAYRIFSRLMCNFVFPAEIEHPKPPSARKFTELAPEQIIEQVENRQDEMADHEDVADDATLPDLSAEYQKDIQEALAKLNTTMVSIGGTRDVHVLSPESLEIHSPKFLRVLTNLQDEKNEGCHLIYSNFRTMEGIGILKQVLEHSGYSEFKLAKTGSGDWSIVESEQKQTTQRFVLYTGTETAEEKEVIRNVYNSNWDLLPAALANQLREMHPNNYRGEIIRVLMITAAGAEGINLENTRFVHIVEPYWNLVRVEQVVGRARRICSHKNLPPEMRTVQVFLYMTAFSPEQVKSKQNIEIMTRDVGRLDGKPITTDQYLYQLASLKDNLTSQILGAIKTTAMDCELYAKNNKENLVCYGYGNVSSNDFGTFPTLEKDAHEKEDMNVVKQVLKPKKLDIPGQGAFVYIPGDNQAYDLNAYLNSKQLVRVGVIVGEGNNRKVVLNK
jgi:hypothetical protein